MTATIATVASEFQKFAPSLEADFIKFVTEKLEALLVTAPTSKDQFRLSGSYCADGATFRAYGYRFLTYRRKLDAKPGEYVSIRGGEAFDAVDHERIAAAAVTYAADQIAAFVIKLTKKLGDMTEVTVDFASFGGFTCQIRGKLAGMELRVEQSRIINVSVKGLAFHQWPALIYADGKKVSEAGLKKLVAAK